MNAIKTVFLLGLLSSILVFGGRAAAGERGMWLGLVIAIGMNFFSYFFSEKIALASSGAQAVTPESYPQIYRRLAPMTERLAQRMGIPPPKLWVTPEPQPNAFATGRNPNHASVAVTAGLLDLMNDQEVEGVVAHELGHVLHRDILISSVAATIGTAITFMAQMAYFFGGRRDDDDRGSAWAGPLMFLASLLIAPMIQMAISRTREFSADAAAAKYTGSPNGLISALRRLDAYGKQIPMDVSPAQSHMYIMNPIRGLFSTHPSTEDRIARLRQLS
ncbi:MAG: zinc metalloprotease HtpX [Bryobacteraceae bacterium]